MTSTSVQPTLLSAIQTFQKHDSVLSKALHPFAISAEQSYSQLQKLIDVADQLAHSLSIYSSTPISNPKLVSLLRQHASIGHTLHQSDRSMHHFIEALRLRSGSKYGEDVPIDSTAIVDWCLLCLENWGTATGMETFKDEGREGGVTVVLGGKVLVIDIDFAIDKSNPLRPTLTVSNVKTSYASTNLEALTSNNGGSTSLDAFFRASVQDFCVEVQKAEDIRDLEQAAKYGGIVLKHLEYLVMLDRLASRKEGDGLKWFVDLDELCSVLETFAQSEAQAIASSLSAARAPLDVFLLRSHALPLPYLISPSISFLVYISPLAYLTLLKHSNNGAVQSEDTKLPQLETSLAALRSQISESISTEQEGFTLATLSLVETQTSPVLSLAMSMPTFVMRPTFLLSPHGSEFEHTFPQRADSSTAMSISDDLTTYNHHTWMLDFTNGGTTRGVVMSQSRMREIDLIINPLGGIDTLNHSAMMSFGTGSWVDLLLNPEAPTSPERYTALYISPTSAHAPLQLRLTAPEEPGFRLQRVPVRNMKEVWGILEIVREQCWLNETLLGCQWSAEGLQKNAELREGSVSATQEELRAVLNGTYPPRKIPVNVFLPSQNVPSEALFQPNDLDGISIPQIPPRRPKIVMTSPERPPISGLVEISVMYDESRPRGIAIEINGAMGFDFELDILEEICRRGGTFGLSGRIWSKSHSSL